jgi:transposase InsO family protein
MRTRRNSNSARGANDLGENDLPEDDHMAIAGSGNHSIDFGSNSSQQEANPLADIPIDGILDPVAIRLSLIAQVNATNLASEKARKIAKGLLVLQSKEPPFELEDLLKTNDILRLELTEDETNELLRAYIANPIVQKNKDNSVKLIDPIVRLSPPLNKESARKLQEWSDKFPDEITPLGKILDSEAVTLLKVLIENNKKKLHLTNEEALNWYTQWTHVELAEALTRLFAKDHNKYRTVDEALESFKLDLDSRQLDVFNTASEAEKVTELHSLINLFPKEIRENETTQKRLFDKLRKLLDKDNIYRKKMEIAFTDKKEEYPSRNVDDWIKCFTHVRSVAREALLTAEEFGHERTTSSGRINKRDPKERNEDKPKDRKDKWTLDKSKPDVSHLTKQERRHLRCTEMYRPDKNCGRCGGWTHKRQDCPSKNPDCNEDPGEFKTSTKGRLWWQNKTLGPFVHQHLDLQSRTFGKTDPTDHGRRDDHSQRGDSSQSHCKYTSMLINSLTQDVLNNKSPMLDYKNNSDFLTMTISLPTFQTAQPVEEGGISGTRKRPRAITEPMIGSINNNVNSLTIQALLDTGCLIGDCISQEIVSKLHANHLIVNTNTTICSGFNNECNNNFPSLVINLSYFNEKNKLLESFETLVFILPRTPIDLIIGRKTLKQQRFSKTVPSHFEDQTNLIESIEMTTEDFVDNISQETYKTLDQVKSKGSPFKAHAHLTTESQSCTSSLKLDDNTVDSKVLTGKEKSVKQDNNSYEDLHPLCLRNKYLSRGSCRDGGSCPCSLQKSSGDQMDVSGLDGLNDTPLLAPVLESDNPPLPLTGAQREKPRELTKKWLLQEDGGYVPVFVEKPAHPFVSSMIHLSSDKPVERKPGVDQTWGMIATLIKQQDQLDVPQKTADNSQDAISALTTNEVIVREESYIDHSHDDDDNDDDFDDTLDTENDVFNSFKNDFGDDPSTDILDQVMIQGTPELRSRIRLILEEYRSVFATTLSEEPATIPPFELEVNLEQWEQFSNRGPPRVQSPAKQAEILRQVDELLKTGIIEPSTASYYSQVILASKPDDEWRFCIDFRKLNDCTKSASWPIPNIKQMFGRLGAHHSDIFGVMDLTAGYHQAPVSLGTRIFLAFICFCGIFQFRRLPFGPKRAPSYFQQMMASVVLIGLIYFICEMYLDDCIVHGRGPDQFCQRLRDVLERFRKHNIFLKPKKCKFGMPLVEYCGNEISEEGLSMSAKKIQKVLDFPKPTTAGQMKQLVGLLNYFRDYCQHHSQIMKPLHDMILNYQKKTRGRALVWTEEGITAFDRIIEEVAKNHKMFFPRDDCPIFLMTDASDYGIGAYCYQLVDNVEQPVAFVSKSLTAAQYKWAILQKEAYSMFYAFRQLRTILRDRPFTVQTDSRGFRFMRNDSNPMVYRWLVDVQEYDFKLEDILGVDNPVADGFSRLVANNMTPSLIASLLPPEPIPEYLHILIGKVHNGVSGHHGVERTVRMLTTPTSKNSKVTLLTEKVPFLRSHVKQYIKLCACCQKMSMIKIPIHAHPFTTSRYYPMECLNIDFVGPFPDGGYVFVAIDTFTRWVELMHAKAATAKEAAEHLLQHFGRFGAPSQLRSDRGSHFVNKVIEEFLPLVGTQHCLTLAYSSQQNAIVERVNKEINRHIRTLTFETSSVDNYKATLPIVQRILNASYSDHTNVSSSQLLFGNAINLDRGLFLPPIERPVQDLPLSVHMSQMLQFQDEVMTKARDIFKKSDEIHMASFSKAKPTEFLAGSYVLVKYRTGKPPTRAHTFWRGPLKVISNDKSEYQLHDLVQNKTKPYHVSDMKQFIFNPLQTDPLDIARRDYLEFFVEKVLDMRGDPKRVQSLTFHIKWLGYDDTHNTWEPWKEVRDVEVLHTYLRANNLTKIIPKKFSNI